MLLPTQGCQLPEDRGSSVRFTCTVLMLSLRGEAARTNLDRQDSVSQPSLQGWSPSHGNVCGEGTHAISGLGRRLSPLSPSLFYPTGCSNAGPSEGPGRGLGGLEGQHVTASKEPESLTHPGPHCILLGRDRPSMAEGL